MLVFDYLMGSCNLDIDLDTFESTRACVQIFNILLSGSGLWKRAVLHEYLAATPFLVPSNALHLDPGAFVNVNGVQLKTLRGP